MKNKLIVEYVKSLDWQEQQEFLRNINEVLVVKIF